MDLLPRLLSFEGEVAVLLVGPEQPVVHLPRSDLPEDASQGDVVCLEGYVDREETERRRAEIREKLERFKRRGDQG